MSDDQPPTTRARALALLVGLDPPQAAALGECLGALEFEVRQAADGAGALAALRRERPPELVVTGLEPASLGPWIEELERQLGGRPAIAWLGDDAPVARARSAGPEGASEERVPELVGLPDGVVRLELNAGGASPGEATAVGVDLEHALVRLMGPYGRHAPASRPAPARQVPFGGPFPVPRRTPHLRQDAGPRPGSEPYRSTAPARLPEPPPGQTLPAGPAIDAGLGGGARRLLVLDRPGWRSRSTWAEAFEQVGAELVELDPATYDPRAERDASGLLLRDEFEAHDLLAGESGRAELAELCGRLPVLVISSRPEPTRAARFAELGADAYLVEPLDARDVLRALHRSVRGQSELGRSDSGRSERGPDEAPTGGPSGALAADGGAAAGLPRDAHGLPWLRLDAQRRVRGWNLAGARLFEALDLGQRGAAEGDGLDFAACLASPAARENCLLVVEEVLHHGLPQCVEWPLRGQDGSAEWVAWDVVPTGADEVCLFGLSARLRERLLWGEDSARAEVEAQLAGSGECLVVLDAERGLPWMEAGPMGAVWGRSLVGGAEPQGQVPLLLNLPEADRPEFAAALARARRGFAAEVLHGVQVLPELAAQRELRLSRLLPLHPSLEGGTGGAQAGAVVVLTAAQSREGRLPGPPEREPFGAGRRPRLSAVLSAAPIVLFTVDPAGQLRLSDPQLLQAFGARPAELALGSVFEEFGDVPLLVESLQRALGGESCSSTVDIGGRQLETSFSPVRDARGRVESVTGVAIDVTSRSHAEHQLKLVVEATSSVVGQGFFRSLVRYLTRALDVRLAYIAELPDRRRPRLRMLCLWSGTEYSEGYDYDAGGTPDGRVLEEGLVHVADGLQLGFGANSWVSAQGVKSYLGVPILDSSGGEIGVLGVMHTKPLGDPVRAESILRIFAARAAGEIERLRSEQAVAESEARWRSLVQNAPDLICTLNRSGRVLFSNKPLGVGPDGPTRIQDLVREADRPALTEALEAVLAEGKPRSLEHELERLDGRWVWFSSRIGLLERESGQGAAILIGTDITHRKEAQAKLEFRVEVEQLVTAISARFINLDHEEVDDGIRTALAQLGALAGIDRAHLFRLEEDGAALVRTHAWVRQGLPGFLGELREDSGSLRWVLPAVREGRELFLRSLGEMGREALDQRMELAALGVRSLIAVPMTCAGERVGFLGFDALRREVDWDPEMLALLRIVGDVFAQTLLRKRSEEAKAELETQLRQAQKLEAIGTLAGGIAHDFNNLLTGILGQAGLLRRRQLDPEARDRAAGIIEKAAQRGADLTAQLLGFAREGTAELEALDLHEVVADMCELLERTLNKNIVVRTALNAESSTVLGDHGQLGAVVLNISLNARDAMPEGGELSFRSRLLDVRSEEAHLYPELRPGAYVELGVSDTGTGIRPELIDRLFEPFFTTKAPGAGTGMGLAMVYGIVREHGGVVRVESELGCGTEFRILVPLVAAGAPARARSAGFGPQVVAGSGRILVVDDEAIVRATAAEMLRELGYEVLLASNGLEGVRTFEQDPEAIDAVLLDLIMPEMDGRECFRELRKLDEQLPIVLSSGWGYENLASEFPEQGGLSGLVRKPYQLAELSTVIARAIAERRLPEVELESGAHVEVRPSQRRPRGSRDAARSQRPAASREPGADGVPEALPVRDTAADGELEPGSDPAARS